MNSFKKTLKDSLLCYVKILLFVTKKLHITEYLLISYFLFSVESSIEHVILTIVCSLDEDIREDMSEYMLRVRYIL